MTDSFFDLVIADAEGFVDETVVECEVGGHWGPPAMCGMPDVAVCGQNLG